MSRVYRQRSGIPARNVEGVMAVITPQSSEIHRLNGVATHIWDRCAQEGATRDELLKTLKEVYDVKEDRLKADLDTFLAEATEKGLLVVSKT
jgi:hypothetical protein